MGEGEYKAALESCKNCHKTIYEFKCEPTEEETLFDYFLKNCRPFTKKEAKVYEESPNKLFKPFSEKKKTEDIFRYGSYPQDIEVEEEYFEHCRSCRYFLPLMPY